MSPEEDPCKGPYRTHPKVSPEEDPVRVLTGPILKVSLEEDPVRVLTGSHQRYTVGRAKVGATHRGCGGGWLSARAAGTLCSCGEGYGWLLMQASANPSTFARTRVCYWARGGWRLHPAVAAGCRLSARKAGPVGSSSGGGSSRNPRRIPGSSDAGTEDDPTMWGPAPTSRDLAASQDHFWATFTREQGRPDTPGCLNFPETASVSGKFRQRDRGWPDHVGPESILAIGPRGPSQLRRPTGGCASPSGTLCQIGRLRLLVGDLFTLNFLVSWDSGQNTN